MHATSYQVQQRGDVASYLQGTREGVPGRCGQMRSGAGRCDQVRADAGTPKAAQDASLVFPYAASVGPLPDAAPPLPLFFFFLFVPPPLPRQRRRLAELPFLPRCFDPPPIVLLRATTTYIPSCMYACMHARTHTRIHGCAPPAAAPRGADARHSPARRRPWRAGRGRR